MNHLDPIITAVKAYSHLNTFAAIVGILECGTVSGSNHAALKIIRICKDEQERLLEMYDEALSKTDNPQPPTL